MKVYERLCAANRALVKGYVFLETEKQDIVRDLLAGVCDRETVRRFHRGVRATGDSRALYPLFYIPPYRNGAKLRLFTGERPQTHILAANHYELEALRLLALWAPEHPETVRMLQATADRLKNACFGRFCSMGECVGAGVAALRFLSAQRLRDDEWIARLLTALLNLYETAPTQFPVYYLFAMLAAVERDAGLAFVNRQEAWILRMLRRGNLTCGMAVSDQAVYNPVRQYVLRGALSLTPQYAYVKDMHI